MSNDENYFNPFENNKSNLSIKQIYKDDNTGKIILTDYNKNKILPSKNNRYFIWFKS